MPMWRIYKRRKGAVVAEIIALPYTVVSVHIRLKRGRYFTMAADNTFGAQWKQAKGATVLVNQPER